MTDSTSPDRRDFLQAAAALGLVTLAGPNVAKAASDRPAADLILRNGRVTTFDPKRPTVTSVALKDGLVMAVGTDAETAKLADARTRIVDVKQRRVIPGLTDSHNHIIRGGLNHNLELRWDGVRRDLPIDQLGWFFDHGETVTPANLERIRKLGGGIAIQNRMSMQGEYFIRRYGQKAAQETPPVKRMLEMGVPVTLGTDATRVNSYNPWQAIYWLVSGRTIGGTLLYPEERRLDRLTALSLMTASGAWFSRDTGRKGVLKPGAFGDVAVLDRDVLEVPEDEIQDTTSVLTIVAGQVVHGSEAFAALAPPLPPASPDWSPVRAYGGYQARGIKLGASATDARYQYAAMCACASACLVHGHAHATAAMASVPARDPGAFWGALGCACAV